MELSVDDHDEAVALAGPPLEPQLALPLKLGRLGHLALDQVLRNVARVRIESDQTHDLHPLGLGEVRSDQIDELTQSVFLGLQHLFHGLVVA
eukprot:985095-Rhodomonas_salina.1